LESEALIERLKNIRKAAGLTQKEFGERMGMALTTWASIEQGRNPLNERARILLEHIYGVNPRYLDYGQEPMFRRNYPVEESGIMFYEKADDPHMDLPNENMNFNRRNKTAESNFILRKSRLEEPESPDSFNLENTNERQDEKAPGVCQECREKEIEIRHLSARIRRLESEIDHQRKVIEYLMEKGRSGENA
jgi:transcriptional regulator with XRE-family HTH domain